MGGRRRRAGAVDSRILWASALAAGVLFAVLLAGIWQFVQLQKSIDRQALLGGAAFAQHDRLLQIVNEETGVRGYIATDDPGYLDIYYSSRRQWDADTLIISRTAAAIPSLERRVRRSITAAVEVHRYFAQEIALMRARRISEAKRNLSQGKLLFDRLRVLDAAVQQHADGELAAQRGHTRLLAKAGLIAAIALCVFLLIWVLGFLIVLRRARNYRQFALRDVLTGALNRRGAIAAIDAEVGAASPEPFGLIFIDLDGFKKINDVFGHAAGDAILQSVAMRLQTELRSEDSVCRLGGDEFVCVIAAPAGGDQVRSIAARLRKSLSQPYSFAGIRMASAAARA